MIFLINNKNNINLIQILLYQQHFIQENLKLKHQNKIIIQKIHSIQFKNVEVATLKKIFNLIINKKR